MAWKIAGIILYVDPLPMPLKMNSITKPVMNTGSEPRMEADKTTSAPTAIATKLTKVTREPPNLSASAPPTGRISEPSSGPIQVSAAAATGVPNCSGYCTCSTCPKAKLKPMKEPNVPM